MLLDCFADLLWGSLGSGDCDNDHCKNFIVFIEQLLSDGYKINILDLNHDPCLNRLLSKQLNSDFTFNDYFKKTSNKNLLFKNYDDLNDKYEECELYKLDPNLVGDINLVKVHGSFDIVDFIDHRYGSHEYCQSGTYKISDQIWDDSSIKQNLQSDYLHFKNTILYEAMNKAWHMNDNESFYYDFVQRKIYEFTSQKNPLLIVGYSFGDKHIGSSIVKERYDGGFNLSTKHRKIVFKPRGININLPVIKKIIQSMNTLNADREGNETTYNSELLFQMFLDNFKNIEITESNRNQNL